MKKSYLLYVITAFFLLTKSTTSAQTISSQKGLTTAVFNTSNGNIKVFLPDDIRQGDVISGRVVAEPEGRNEKQLARNLAELTKYAIRINGEKFAVENAAKTFRFSVPAGQPMQGSLDLMNGTGTNPIQQLTIPAKPLNEQKPAPAQCVIPGHVITGSPMTIPGPFDGNAATTQCTIGSQPATVLAESPRSCIVAFPANAYGMQATEIKETGQQPCTKNVSGVQLDVSAGKLNLLKGEKTYIEVKISGLQNLPAPAILKLINITTDVVIMQPSNIIAVPLESDSLSSGTFNRQFDVQSIRSGNFVVNVNLDFGDIMLTPKDPEDPKPADPKPEETGSDKGKNAIPAGTEVKADPPKVVIEKDDPKNPITWDTIPKTVTACNPTLLHKIGQTMDGGLRNSFIGANNSVKSMQRDDFIVLEADGNDVDLAVKTCTKIEECPQTGCSVEVPIAGRVRFEWKTVEDPKGNPEMRGSFVQIGCIPDNFTAKGEQVIFKPPFLPEASIGKPENTIFCTIILSIIDAGSPVPDVTIEKTITIAITRTKISPDKYTVNITGGAYKPTPGAAPADPAETCTCIPYGPLWDPGDNLEIPKIILPAIEKDNNKLVLGEKILLTTQDQKDMDIATYGCTTSCPTTTIKKSYHDIVRWKWIIEKLEGIDMGSILLSDSSQYIVYEAPKKFPVGTDFLDIKISVEVYNPKGRVDASKTLGSAIVFRVYKPGIRLNYTPLEWRPGENNFMELKSELMYKSAGKWLPGFDHMARIQYFELFKISQEKGVCMNYSLPGKNDFCFDLQLKKQEGLEFNKPVDLDASICTLKDQYMQANTERPVKEFGMTIYSLDYGAYGFFRSFANKNNGMNNTAIGNYEDKGRESEPIIYESIPWLKTEVLHPLYTNNRVMLKEYDDNRVTIPHDVDENHIADIGWKSIEGTTLKDVPDPALNNSDEDDIPIGNKTKGDGLTSYEEYRGFKLLLGSDVIFTRTNHLRKDIFIYNKHNLDISLFTTVTGLEVHEVKAENILPDAVGDDARSINFNFTKGSPTHIVSQRALRLINAGTSTDDLLGIACPDNACKYPGTVAPPNWIYEIRINKDAIFGKEKLKGYDPKLKLAQVVAHELCHGINICHHGDGDLNKETDFDMINGVCSGDIDCVMRYDNSGTHNMGKNGDKVIPETIGSKLCISPVGTGYNTTSKKPGYGDAAPGRGNCLNQMQITGFGIQPIACKQ